ncbi:MAG TPA: gamma carbonic anhydrase family protein [Thermopetrobacter sp.]|nr:gamma carbonic anhydrase family protein [Thermopetrobacter sp.]
MTVYAYDGHEPHIGHGCFVAPSAAVIGMVTLKERASVWFSAVLRGDYEPIVIGAGSNVQDSATLHTDTGFPLTVGAGVVIGHNAIVHGCTIGDDVLIGMGAIVMNGAVIGAGSIIAAGALIPEGREIPPRSLVVGTPGKVVREVDDAGLEMIREGARHYVERAAKYRETLKPL